MERFSPCKINLLLNILGKRSDGFHELETVMLPVPVGDRLWIEKSGGEFQFECRHPQLAADACNLVWRAAQLFFQRTGLRSGARIRLEKNLPLAAGIGGGSSNAAQTLLGLNELFNHPLEGRQLAQAAADLGSDVPFFLQSGPALALGRGERVEPLPPFESLRDVDVILAYPGFGISTAWAYQQLSRHPELREERPGKAQALIDVLRAGNLDQLDACLFNSLEGPALRKYPILAIYQEFFRRFGALGARMSGSGSATFALVKGDALAAEALEQFRREFGGVVWTARARLG